MLASAGSVRRSRSTVGPQSTRGRGKQVFHESISLGLYAHEGRADDQLRLLREEARLAEAAGFDGVSMSEHHNGFPGYFPVPLTLAAMLSKALSTSWAIACPTLL